jgi:hypothetical protein
MSSTAPHPTRPCVSDGGGPLESASGSRGGRGRRRPALPVVEPAAPEVRVGMPARVHAEPRPADPGRQADAVLREVHPERAEAERLAEVEAHGYRPSHSRLASTSGCSDDASHISVVPPFACTSTAEISPALLQ